jgi:hypothetical protein
LAATPGAPPRAAPTAAPRSDKEAVKAWQNEGDPN